MNGEENILQSPRAVPEKEVLNLAKYMLSTDIPDEQRKRFESIYLLFDRDYALANIQRRDMPYFNVSFEYITELIAAGMYEYAQECMVQLIQDLKLSRSIDALQLRIGVSGVQRSESISRFTDNEKKRNVFNKIKNVFKNDNNMEEIE